MGVAGYAHFLALAQRSQWDENDVVLTLDGWDDERRQYFVVRDGEPVSA